VWPEVYELGGRAVTLYDVMRVVAIVAAVSVATILNRRQGISARVTLGIALCCAPLAILGAWLFDAVESAPSVGAIGDELGRRGSSAYGALFTTVIVVLVAAKAFHVAPLRLFDVAGPGLAIGEAVSRLGCFSAGCCYGRPWNGPWAVEFPPGSFAINDQWQRGIIDVLATHALPVHPVQLYGTLFMTGVAVLLTRRFLRPHVQGEIFFTYLVVYGAYRLALAQFRMEVLASTLGFSAVFIAAGLTGLYWSRLTASGSSRAAA
jgi:phosphatidylglycerol:prolipoprotein diacylglycerol transferase